MFYVLYFTTIRKCTQLIFGIGPKVNSTRNRNYVYGMQSRRDILYKK